MYWATPHKPYRCRQSRLDDNGWQLSKADKASTDSFVLFLLCVEQESSNTPRRSPGSAVSAPFRAVHREIIKVYWWMRKGTVINWSFMTSRWEHFLESTIKRSIAYLQCEEVATISETNETYSLLWGTNTRSENKQWGGFTAFNSSLWLYCCSKLLCIILHHRFKTLRLCRTLFCDRPLSRLAGVAKSLWRAFLKLKETSHTSRPLSCGRLLSVFLRRCCLPHGLWENRWSILWLSKLS